MINIKELQEKNKLWIIEHIEKLNMLYTLINNNECKIRLLETISILENELIKKEGISTKETYDA